MERFPLSQIQEPTARMNQDRRDVYNNIVLFAVDVAGGGADSEMHIFQCINKPVSLSLENQQHLSKSIPTFLFHNQMS